MFPSFPPYGGVHGLVTDTVLFAEAKYWFPLGSPFANQGNLRRCEFVYPLPALLCLVLHIVGGCSQKQVRRIAAMTIIATMANVHAVGYRANMEFVAEPIWEPRTARVKQIAPTFCGSALPLPTFIWAALYNACPKAFFERTLFDGRQWPERAVMTVYKAFRSINEPTRFGTVTRCQWRVLPAAALALAVRLQQSVFGNPRSVFSYVFGKIWGTIHDVFSPSRLLTTPPNDSTRCGGNFIGCYSFILAQLSQKTYCVQRYLEGSE